MNENKIVKPMSCYCTSAYQDVAYGRGMRVHNPCVLPKGLKLTGYRCTVCGNKKVVL